MKEKKTKSFETEMLLRPSVCNFGAVAVYLFYSFIFAKITPMQFLEAIGIGSCLLVFMQFIVGPLISNRICSHKVSLELQNWEENEQEYDDKKRTAMLSNLMSRPLHKAIEIFIIYFISGIIFCCWFKLRLKVSNIELTGIFVAMVFASIVDGALAMHVAERICSKIAVRIIEQGINKNQVLRKKFFGMSLKGLYALFIFVPIIFTNILTGIYIWANFIAETSEVRSGITMFSLFAVPIFNAIITIVLAVFLGFRLANYLHNMQNAILKMDQTNITTAKPIPTDLSNEISFNMYLINNAIDLFKNILEKTADVAIHVTESTETLETLSTETASTALEQSTGVKEIVSTMEDADKLFKNIEGKVGDVTLVANKTATEVQTGINSLAENMEKMQQITEANMETITGIKALSEKIDSIWEIVTIINSIADQTKIIAFNAELEAASAGEAGKNFHIVANEIRRLADGTMESTREIKERITEIQHSSDNLIITSEGGTEKIHQGCDLAEQVNQNFSSIKNAAEITAESAQDIQLIVSQQTAAFEQIVITLKQISAGADSFSGSTQTIRSAVEKLQQMADSMNNIISYKCEESSHKSE